MEDEKKMGQVVLSRRKKAEIERREKEVKDVAIEAIKQISEQVTEPVTEQVIEAVVQQAAQEVQEQGRVEQKAQQSASEEKRDVKVEEKAAQEEQDEVAQWRATGALAQAVVRAAKTVIYYIRPKDTAKYTIAFMPSPDHTYELPEQFFKMNVSVFFNFKKRRIDVFSQEERIYLAWVDLTDDIEQSYERAVSYYKTSVRTVLESLFVRGAEMFSATANVR